MGVSYVKFCPRCQTTTSVDSALCPNCGHHFRTHFQPKASEKTVAMTSASQADRLQPGPLREIPPDQRPILRPRLVLLSSIILALVGLIYGTHVRHSQQSAPVPKAAFQPYDVIVKNSPRNDPAPVATRSPEDLRQWQATQPKRTTGDDASVGDDPVRVHLYFSKRIVLVPGGTPGRVLLEQGTWRRIQILEGLHRGTTGYISRDFVERPQGLSQKSVAAQTSER